MVWTFQVIADLVRLYLLLVEGVPERALSQLGQAGVPLRRPMLTGMAGEKSRRPQFVRIAEFLGLAAGQIPNPCLCPGGGGWVPAHPPPPLQPPPPPLSPSPPHPTPHAFL